MSNYPNGLDPRYVKPFDFDMGKGFIASCLYEGAMYSVNHSEEEWRTFLNHNSELYDTEFKKIVKFLEDNGKNKMMATELRKKLELQVVRHYNILPVRDDIIEIMGEIERETYYVDLYEIDPENVKAKDAYIRFLKKQLDKQYDVTNDLFDENEKQLKTIGFQEKIIKKLKSMNERLKRIEMRKWRDGTTVPEYYCTEPNYDGR